MHLQFFSDGSSNAPMLVLGAVSPADAAELIAAVRGLASGTATRVAVHELAGCVGVGQEPGVALEVVIGIRDAGCRPAPGAPGQFKCALRPVTWDQVAGLLEPFARDSACHIHQYLSDEGPVTWVVSTDSGW